MPFWFRISMTPRAKKLHIPGQPSSPPWAFTASVWNWRLFRNFRTGDRAAGRLLGTGAARPPTRRLSWRWHCRCGSRHTNKKEIEKSNSNWTEKLILGEKRLKLKPPGSWDRNRRVRFVVSKTFSSGYIPTYEFLWWHALYTTQRMTLWPYTS